eukprot:Gregarina_sp_Poly_1__8919@NODE_539_length_7612_cov_394_304042_g426_i0_p2_GENE_NODE_539_length_7612_cov_394_304042_g426_i0NODE_539_length_7612_cov_394_304042_g426_i0_p2_ORF_typecomplete_len339_score47_10Integrin_beta/PF00362_18/4_8e19VWA/PF00092_28/0_008_NODE_539_length_7612_cov_394_304042_g426_i020253041
MWSLCFLSAFLSQCGFSLGKELKEIYGSRPAVKFMSPRVPPEAATIRSEYDKSRVPENCIFPIDVLIIQDATESMHDDWEPMRDTQLPAMIEVLSQDHPGSRFAVMMHQDKPVWPLGLPTDYCVRVGNPFTQHVEHVVEIYNNTFAYGGADEPECQFVALLAASQMSYYQWAAGHTRLLVVATDARPHFDQDGFNTMGLPPASGIYDEANPDEQCKSEYYPSPDHVKSSVLQIGAYVGAVIFDEPHGRVASAWEWTIRHLGQPDEFLNVMSSDSTDFWAKLSEIITALEAVECMASTTPPPETTESLCPPCTTRECRRHRRSRKSLRGTKHPGHHTEA